VIGFAESTGKIGLLVPTGAPVVSSPAVGTVAPVSFRLVGDMDIDVPATGTASPIVTDAPAIASGTEATGYFIEAAVPGTASGPLGIEHSAADPPGTFYYADYGARVIGRASLPLPEDGWVTGGGWIDVPGGRADFSLTAFRREPGGAVRGTFRYKNHATGETIQSTEITDLFVYGTTAVFSGTMMVGSVPGNFTVQVSDQGEPGTKDTFLIAAPGSTIGNTLAGGNIQIHRKD
jgi:hypothetical protein